MAEDEDKSDKEHEPTQKRLDDARKKGEIPRSQDVTTAAAYGGIVLAAMAFGPATLTTLGGALMMPLDRAPDLANAIFGSGGVQNAARGAPFAGGVLKAVAAAMSPWFAVPAALALLAIIAQQALLFTPEKLKPKLNRISPLATFKQKFGRNGLFEFAKSTAKLLIYSVILGVFLWGEMPRIIAMLSMPPGPVIAELGRITIRLMWMVLVVAVALGALDYLWQRFEHLSKNRMSRKELKDEMKESDGDPQVKGQRRQRAVSLAMNQMLAEVPKADVVIVNPTHYAVALAWDRRRGTAPKCIAKGTDEIALRIREVAMENGVPIHSDPPTARALHATVEIGREVGTDHYRAVAAAIRFADRLRKRKT